MRFDDTQTAERNLLYRRLEKDLHDAITITKEVDGDFEMVIIAVSLPDGELAVKVANVLLFSFLKHTRTAIDETLIKQKKSFSAEVTRYRRMLSELETKAMRAIALWDLPAEVDLGDDYSIPKVVAR